MMDRPGRGSSGQGVRQGAGALLLAALGYLPATVGIANPPEVPFHTGHDPATLVAAASGTPAHPAPSAAPAADRRAPRSAYTWPTGGPAAVLEGFDPPAVVWGSGHRGVDLALAAGSPVLAAGDGTVVFAGMVAGRPVVSIDHADGIRTTYEPVEAVVSTGDAVGRGQVIGTLVAGHRSDGVDALHWGARTGPKTYINPLRLLDPPIIRLKPVQ